MKVARTIATVAALGLAGTPADADNALGEAVAGDYAYLEELFVHFHRNPELSFRETATAARLAAELRGLGLTVTEGVGGTGLVSVIENGAGPTVLIRADMDGLPIKEQSGLAYASVATQTDIDGEVKPVMHACGHDVHITALVGTARRLLALKDRWRGTVVLIAQPAEERIGGARAMLEDGLYDRFPRPDYALAFHVSAGEPAGRVAVLSGLVMSSSDSVNITVHGVGAHGASPHKSRDPIYIASQIVVSLQSLVSRELAPLEPGVVTVGSFHGGSKHNIIPDRVDLQLTVRADSQETRETLLAGIVRIAEGVARAAGLPEDKLPTVEWGFESTPTTYNDPATAERVRAAFERELGAERMYEDVREGMGAEDFAYFTQVDPPIPGVYFTVGGTTEADIAAEKAGGPPVPSHHSPFFRIEPKPAITSGVEAMTVAALELLGKPGTR